MKQTDSRSQKHLHRLTEDEIQELTNLAIEMNSLCRIFAHAACDQGPKPDGSRRIYADVTSLLRPICQRLEELRKSIMAH